MNKTVEQAQQEITDSQRIMIMHISIGVLLKVLRGDIRFADLDLPSDAQVLEVHNDPLSRGLFILIHSASFAPTPVGCEYPRLPPLALTFNNSNQ